MKSIFISIPWFTPAFKAGGPVQSIANMVEALNEGYQFYIYTSNEDLHKQPIAVAHTDQWVEYNDYTKVWYSGKHDRSQHLVEQAEALKPDILYVIGLFDWHFNIVPLLYAKAERKLVSVRGMLHPGALSQKSWKKRIFIQGMKWMKIDKKISFQATDEAEAVFIKNVFKEAQVSVAGNFPRLLNKQLAAPKEPGHLKMVSIGIISPMKNYLPVLQALSEVKTNIHYTIYGPVKESVYWEQCLQAIRTLPENITVDYQKELPPHKVPVKLESKHLFILPSKSENYGHAIVEALSAGLPVITSYAVPWTGLSESMAGVNVEPTVANIRQAIKSFAAMEQEEYNQYCEGAREYVLGRVNLDDLKQEYEGMFG